MNSMLIASSNKFKFDNPPVETRINSNVKVPSTSLPSGNLKVALPNIRATSAIRRRRVCRRRWRACLHVAISLFQSVSSIFHFPLYSIYKTSSSIYTYIFINYIPLVFFKIHQRRIFFIHFLRNCSATFLATSLATFFFVSDVFFIIGDVFSSSATVSATSLETKKMSPMTKNVAVAVAVARRRRQKC